MKIREATIHDFIAIQSLSIQLGHEYPLDKVKDNLVSILKDKEHKILLAVNEDTDEIIGYIHLQKYKTLYSEDLLNIVSMVIERTWRNKGVGSTLIKKAEIIAGEFNCKGLRAASSANRIDAHVFYQQNAFDLIKDQKRFIKIINE